MIYSFTQVAHYLRCPRSYPHRYLDGWREKETRAAMIFGRCFEKALESSFKDEDCGATLFRELSAFRDAPLEYKKGETWDRSVQQVPRLGHNQAIGHRPCRLIWLILHQGVRYDT